ncbi:Excinuclease ABC subunit C [hydrothermal vent metagenome]|uniref:Excinuclease ABC subunit C n=1 Tax=hydrothermal vent metagenome TaxID=652676 RepID=A0A3B1BXZ8_9ZZZZ
MKEKFPHLKETLENLPAEPGVYKMQDGSGKILYIGKAKSLRSRVRSYFQPSAVHSPRISIMVSKVKSVDLVVTASEVEALVLEDNLIKKEKPLYNIDLKDGKNYPYLKLTMEETYPRLILVRRVEKDKGLYFGPYVSGKSVRSNMRLIQKIFPLRQSRDNLDNKPPRRPCLNHQMGRCLAPCAGNVSGQEYRKVVDEVILFLKGRNRELSQTLHKRMIDASEKQLFEIAARYRDQMEAIKRLNEKQIITQTNLANQDMIAAYEEGGKGIILILQARRGKMNAERSFMFSQLDRLDRAEALGAFIRQFYTGGMEIPATIITQEPPDGAPALCQWLSSRREAKTRIVTPIRGRLKKLLEMAERNAKIRLRSSLQTENSRIQALEDLREIFGIDEDVRIIEGYDISNTSGVASVGSMVMFRDGAPSKADYRKYKIRTVTAPDDYASIAEVIERRFTRLVNDDKPFADLLVIDGGKGHVKAAIEAFERIGVEPPPMVGIAKGKDRGDIKTDQFFLPGQREPVDITPSSPGRLLLQRVRDEAHRFAISYHRKVRSDRSMKSALDDIPGIGPKRKKALLRKFGSVKRIREAGVADLQEALSISEKTAKKIRESL